MKFPRELAAGEREKAPRCAFGYSFTRQLGARRRLTPHTGGQHHFAIPRSRPARFVPFSSNSWNITASRWNSNGSGSGSVLA
jgi:hypothetical protein